MAAAALGDVDDLDFDLGFIDGLECFDFEFDLPDMGLTELCHGGDGECLLPAVADKEGGLGLDLGSRDGGDGGRESSPDSVVTDDGAPPLSLESSGDRDDGEMSAYVGDLERFLMESEDDAEAGGPFAAKGLAANDHLFDDLAVADDGYVEPSTAAEEFAAAGYYYFGDLDDGYAEPATPGKDLVLDDYLFGDPVVAGDGYIEPYTAGEDLVSDDYFYDVAAVDDAAREDDDEATSRKRARQRKGAAAVPREAELRGTPVMHAISSISTGNGCRPIGHHWLHPCATVCLLA
ncbi:hypothetical protein CFC21_025742 [Triticum aestivum]|uniref:Uncharacterized protein n=2 Tax=Triticum aestivum TaxID=4565 RepID=A0A9R1EJ76_WHEAT|nr:uncharacterized protein LOC123046931 [Triticum aestivum]KAF7011428.1 hypothetical protein CFC21_025742 [Triticum aestivum]